MRIEDLPPIVAERAGHLLPLLQGHELPEPTGWHVLVLQYVRPDTMTFASGVKLHVAAKTQNEDKYQGRTGLVLAVGPRAYADTERFGDKPWVKPGDWVIWPATSAAVSRFEYGSSSAGTRAVLALLTDDQMLATGVEPEQVLA